jgi:hypothetical protein
MAMLNRLMSCAVLAGVLTVSAMGAGAAESWEKYTSQVRVKKALADKMSPAQYQAHVQNMAKLLAAKADGSYPAARSGPGVRASADNCTAATPEVSTLPYANASTTVGLTDDYDLPADTTNPTCAAVTTCTGTGTAGSLPRGAIYTGTGTGPDRAYRIQTSAACTLSIAMTPGSQDLALELFQNQCSSALADCGCVSDAGVAGSTETISLTAVAGQPYFVVVDGYSSGATPPGPSDTFNLNISATAGTCSLTPVELQTFGVD